MVEQKGTLTMTGKKRKPALYCVVGILVLIVGVGVVWLCCFSESALLKEAAYDVQVSESPELRAKLYSLGEQGYLLVLYLPGTSTKRGFIVDMEARTMGIPDFTSYTRLGRFALVDKMTLLGYPDPGELIADFEKNGDRWIIKVTGSAFDPEFDHPDTRPFLEEELIYEKKIVLTPKHE